MIVKDISHFHIYLSKKELYLIKRALDSMLQDRCWTQETRHEVAKLIQAIDNPTSSEQQQEETPNKEKEN